MKTLKAGDFKSRLAKVLEQVKTGTGFAVTHGKKRKLSGLPDSIRKLGPLEGEASVQFKDDFKISEQEFLG